MYGRYKITFVPLTEMEGRSYFDVLEYAVFSPTGRKLLTVDIKEDVIGDIRVGRLRVAMGERGWIWVWDIEQNWNIEYSQETLYVPPDFPSSASMSCIALSPDGMLVAAAINQILHVCRLDTWQVIALLRGHQGEIKQMVFSPDSIRLVTGATDGTARVWDISSGTQLVVLKEYAGRSIGISPDGRMLAIGLFSNAVSIASMENGERLMMLEGHTQPVTMLSFSPAGRSLLSADQSGQVLFWRVDADGRTMKNGHGADGLINRAPITEARWGGMGHMDINRVHNTETPLGMYLAANAIAAVHWQDERHVILADLGGVQNRPHFYHLALEGIW